MRKQFGNRAAGEGKMEKVNKQNSCHSLIREAVIMYQELDAGRKGRGGAALEREKKRRG